MILIIILLTALSSVLVWYIFRLVGNLRGTYGFVISLLEEITNYHEHLERVHNMETFYGDSVLGGLLEHTKNLRQSLTEAVKEGTELFGENPPQADEQENLEVLDG